VFKRLGLAKRGAKAMESQNYRLFETFTEHMFAKDKALYTKWLAAKMTPEDVFKTLQLDKMKPAKATKTKDFRRYEVYLYKWYDGKQLR